MKDEITKIQDYFHNKLGIQFNPEDEEFFEELIGTARNDAKKILVQGWQGKDKLNIVKTGTEWHITEHRKDRDTGEVAYATHIIPEINVANVWMLITNRVKIVGEKTKSREIAADLILKHHLPVGIDELWGGKFRSKYLFPLLYHPLKILQNQGHIKYGCRGDITRLK